MAAPTTRRIVGAAMTGATYGAAALALLPLLAILVMLATKGAGSLDWAFFTKLPAPVGEPGGVAAGAVD